MQATQTISEGMTSRLVQDFMREAIDRSASDIHFEPHADGMVVRFRIDGILHRHTTVRAISMQHITSHIKVLGALNLAQKRIPQDGKFHFTHLRRDIDIRVSTFPTVWGEKVVLRILDRKQQPIALEKLGLSATMYESLVPLLAKSSGFILVSGPTGSGKTTTLYAALHRLNTPLRHIITLEDPVEYHLPGVTQGQIHPAAGFTFESGMRSLLRQDPDVVMIGEIRDQQTAGIAIEASLTGHLVFSTVHTNDAPSVIMRLMDMGVEPFLINASVSGVLAQRLARMLCTVCRVEVAIPEEHAAFLRTWQYPRETVWQAKGCKDCNSLGYKGRVGIFELMIMSDAMRALLVHVPSFSQLRVQAQTDGLISLMRDGLDKVAAGIIDVPELLRVVM